MYTHTHVILGAGRACAASRILQRPYLAPCSRARPRPPTQSEIIRSHAHAVLSKGHPNPHTHPLRAENIKRAMMRLVFVITLLASANAICDGQMADLTLVCNDNCQYPAQQSSSGCGWTLQDPCYQCCWYNCLTTEGGWCASQEYESCDIGGSCLIGHCLFGPSGGGGGGGSLGGGSIAGISIGSICGVVLLAGIVRCLCKRSKDHTDQLTEMTPPSIE